VIGVGPWRGFIGPTALRFGYMIFNGERYSMSLRALIWFTLNAGLMRPRRGFTPVAGKKTGVGKNDSPLDRSLIARVKSWRNYPKGRGP
jgi:hypothetical protein